MRQDRVLVRALVETGGNLYNSNIISRLGEEMGTAIYQAPIGKTLALRDANNGFLYTEPSKLPANAPDDQLSTEPHSLSRMFTGAAYEVMIGMYLKNSLGGKDGLESLKQASNDLMNYIYKAVKTAPAGATMFMNMARAMITVDSQAGGPYGEILTRVFAKRGLIPAVSMLRAEQKPYRVETKPVRELVRSSKLGLTSFAGSMLDVSFHIPLDEYRSFDAAGNLLEEHIPDREATYAEALKFVNRLEQMNKVGPGKEFDVEDGILVRNHISCKGV
jgi:hypothetical protein